MIETSVDTSDAPPTPSSQLAAHSSDQELRTVNDNAAVYYQGSYWNDYAYVRDRINERISGRADTPWFAQFHQLVSRRRFKKALILCCGNGWVERELWRRGLFEQGVGVDYAEPLLERARAEVGDCALRYYQMDINTAVFPEDGFDLVINYAAAHHIAHIDRVFRAIARLLPPDGYFVSFDYVGPHRNQYHAQQFNAAAALNRTLPPPVQQDLRYPHLPTMLVNDPTEAIHSELIVPVMQRYFTLIEQRQVGGALAYPLLTHNEQLSSASAAEQERCVRTVMDADGDYLEAHPHSSLFAYIVAQPNKAALSMERRLHAWTIDEQQREQAAHAMGGRYYELQPEVQNTELSDLRVERAWLHETVANLLSERAWLQGRNAELEDAMERIEQHTLVRLVRWLRGWFKRGG